ncbi:hypothetical protein EIN_508920 [Entamoeba invadens IP1]|uniref:Uncharacterized protein n=1 Tax=Entamoeba invadens IP1 TaxID=370355 RepID=A0A0A1UFR1_ENTIV|nr:hypothetical protein EIN_508920 [Entamoeba invadens IP1]ELP92881.1 hypothetical protein EIN_508920 [Entamoeba invadens IP1]|eukprot:XP_004259652.1 hypothetical protein EIN_508920 [Entamoeba invadens IP1]
MTHKLPLYTPKISLYSEVELDEYCYSKDMNTLVTNSKLLIHPLENCSYKSQNQRVKPSHSKYIYSDRPKFQRRSHRYVKKQKSAKVVNHSASKSIKTHAPKEKNLNGFIQQVETPIVDTQIIQQTPPPVSQISQPSIPIQPTQNDENVLSGNLDVIQDSTPSHLFIQTPFFEYKPNQQFHIQQIQQNVGVADQLNSQFLTQIPTTQQNQQQEITSVFDTGINQNTPFVNQQPTVVQQQANTSIGTALPTMPVANQNTLPVDVIQNNIKNVFQQSQSQQVTNPFINPNVDPNAIVDIQQYNNQIFNNTSSLMPNPTQNAPPMNVQQNTFQQNSLQQSQSQQQVTIPITDTNVNQNTVVQQQTSQPIGTALPTMPVANQNTLSVDVQQNPLQQNVFQQSQPQTYPPVINQNGNQNTLIMDNQNTFVQQQGNQPTGIDTMQSTNQHPLYVTSAPGIVIELNKNTMTTTEDNTLRNPEQVNQYNTECVPTNEELEAFYHGRPIDTRQNEVNGAMKEDVIKRGFSSLDINEMFYHRYSKYYYIDWKTKQLFYHIGPIENTPRVLKELSYSEYYYLKLYDGVIDDELFGKVRNFYKRDQTIDLTELIQDKQKEKTYGGHSVFAFLYGNKMEMAN